ncbi:hypothetical protein AVEN_68164-1 [Araneus ventricosus]|uniref:Uncharacterized protein n=1 Tax=Araneus ventricosus TaxID=182803 RepID=A0A4Y2WGX0_ARAVE|nr:hypothetical protein AVEN_68164-1 [Araneus ventricosus]
MFRKRCRSSLFPPSELGTISTPHEGDNHKNLFYSAWNLFKLQCQGNSGVFPGVLALGLLLSEDPICGVTECLQDALILHIARVHNTR